MTWPNKLKPLALTGCDRLMAMIMSYINMWILLHDYTIYMYHPFMINNSVAVHVNETSMWMAAVVVVGVRQSDHVRRTPHHHRHYHHHIPTLQSLTYDDKACRQEWRFLAGRRHTWHSRDRPSKVTVPLSGTGHQVQAMGECLGPPEALAPKWEECH